MLGRLSQEQLDGFRQEKSSPVGMPSYPHPRAMQEFSFQVFEAFTAATVMYLAINIVVVTGMRFLERSLAIPGYITGK